MNKQLLYLLLLGGLLVQPMQAVSSTTTVLKDNGADINKHGKMDKPGIMRKESLLEAAKYLPNGDQKNRVINLLTVGV